MRGDSSENPNGSPDSTAPARQLKPIPLANPYLALRNAIASHPAVASQPDGAPDFFSEADSDPDEPAVDRTRRRFLLGATAGLTGFALYANQVSTHEIDTTHSFLSIPNLPDAFHNFRIVQISDLHLEEFTDEHFLRRIVEHVNHLAPDLVLITGDYISNGPRPAAFALRAAVRCAGILSKLTCPLRFGCLGNHDADVGSRQVIERITPSGLHILVNQHIPFERNGQRLWLAAVDDTGRGRANLDLAIPRSPGAPVLLMAHEPDYAAFIVHHPRAANIDVVLSGHSHGGQVRLPWLPPLTLPVGALRYYEGLYRVAIPGKAHALELYVNRGIGTVGVPFRLNCPPEVTLHTLRPA
jgi:predicted MPP superfamily phosphohydrolase